MWTASPATRSASAFRRPCASRFAGRHGHERRRRTCSRRTCARRATASISRIAKVVARLPRPSARRRLSPRRAGAAAAGAAARRGRGGRRRAARRGRRLLLATRQQGATLGGDRRARREIQLRRVSSAAAPGAQTIPDRGDHRHRRRRGGRSALCESARAAQGRQAGRGRAAVESRRRGQGEPRRQGREGRGSGLSQPRGDRAGQRSEAGEGVLCRSRATRSVGYPGDVSERLVSAGRRAI